MLASMLTIQEYAWTFNPHRDQEEPDDTDDLHIAIEGGNFRIAPLYDLEEILEERGEDTKPELESMLDDPLACDAETEPDPPEPESYFDFSDA